MNDGGKSDNPIVPKKCANKADGTSAAERMEGRGLAKGNSEEQTRFWTQGQVDLQHALDRIRKAAEADKEMQFTALWHHVYNINRLRQVFYALKREAAPGVDGQTWSDYEAQLEANLRALSERLQRGSYKAKAVRRVYIPKPDGRQRPLGVTALEDKLVQKAVVEVLNAVYEADFLGFSYGFRPGRSQHKALDAVTVAIERRRIRWILDADIQGFFDAVDHEWLMKFLSHRIADQRVLRHVKKWLNAGVLEDNTWRAVEEGVPQGGSISPLLANVYLHYALDLWVQQWRKRHSHGEVVIVRYADDFIVGFQYQGDAERFLEELRDRLGQFHLKLHPEKTRLIEFGRFAATNRRDKGEGKPETFDFLGFTHICDAKRDGRFCVTRKTMAKRMRAKLTDLGEQLRRRMHRPIPETGEWLARVLLGHYQYYGVPRNIRALSAFRYWVGRLWFRSLKRRSGKSRLTWEQMERRIKTWLPLPRIVHAYPDQRLRVTT